MEAVDADNDWAEYKLVATMADTSRRIIFFTDPTAASGQLQMLGFSNDFSAFYFDTGIRSWGEQAPSCDVNLEIQTPLPDDADTQDLTLRLDCWDADTGAPTTAAYTDQYNNYAWQEFTEVAMEAVDADNDWAAYKLVGTMADESKRIVFFTDPAATAGQMQVLGFNNDFSVFYFDTGIRSWGEEEPVCNNVEVQTRFRMMHRYRTLPLDWIVGMPTRGRRPPLRTPTSTTTMLGRNLPNLRWKL